MFKYLPVFATVVALGTGSAYGQQREAILQKIEVPNASFDIVLATANPSSPSLYFRDQPDPNVVYLGENLVIAYTEELADVLDVATLVRPVPAIEAQRDEKKGPAQAIVYVVPKRGVSTISAMR